MESSTSVTLLDALKAGPSAPEWSRFVGLYEPVIKRWAINRGFNQSDSEDLTQEILLKLYHTLPDFLRQGSGSFRAWLFRLTVNAGYDYRRRVATRNLPSPDGLSGLAEVPLSEWDQTEYLRDLSRQGLETIRSEFSPSTMSAFWQTKIEGRSPAQVATELGISVGAVYSSVNRVLTRLRQVLQGLLE